MLLYLYIKAIINKYTYVSIYIAMFILVFIYVNI